eukprot:TRINITY_DN16707_c0_g1_i1.p1 TRINITY_DN16707_c0_g1~~TRINITY_DN16707_c0_g1_i1.p1  ORF type:complete len:182 (-),score=43.08 TRINITY_DN16707_c0_g1_i1:57-602(-)
MAAREEERLNRMMSGNRLTPEKKQHINSTHTNAKVFDHLKPVTSAPSSPSKDDTEVCPKMGLHEDDEEAERESERLAGIIHVNKGIPEVDPRTKRQQEIEAKNKEARHKQMMQKLEARKRQHEQKMRALHGDLPEWQKRHNEKMARGDHLKKEVTYTYEATGPVVQREIPPALRYDPERDG